MKRFGSLASGNGLRRLGLAGVGVLAFLSLLASEGRAQPTNDNFANAVSLTGSFGTTTEDTTGATAEPGEPRHAGMAAGATVWFAWTAPDDGQVEFDTYGSDFDTVLAAYTGSSVANLNMLAANDATYLFGTFQPSYGYSDANLQPWISVYWNPSKITFNARGGATYYIAVDGYQAATGNLSLSWAYRSAGVFRFTTDYYFCGGNEGNVISGSVGWTLGGVRITVTRTVGAVGRALVDVETVDGTAVAGQNYGGISGTMTFDDYEMSKSFVIQVGPDRNFTNGTFFGVLLSNPRLDDLESADVAPPRLDPDHSVAAVEIGNLNVPIPFDPTDTNDHAVVNFESATYRTVENVAGSNAVIYVRRTGRLGTACRIGWAIDTTSWPGTNLGDNGFWLQAGSDYATPDPYTATPATLPPSDFYPANKPPAYGELTWGQGDFGPKAISIPIYNDDEPQFNQDLRVILAPVPGASDNAEIGSVGETTVTILYDDYPAGAVNPGFNPDNQLNSEPPMNVAPGANAAVNSVVLQVDGKSIVGGEFTTYNGTKRKHIARVTASGTLDTGFDPGDGFANNAPMPASVTSLALDSADRVIVGGLFASFNGVQRNGIARLKPDGSLDTTFNPGLGTTNSVWAVALQSDGKILLAGEFEVFNGVLRQHIARLNDDGSIDPTFDPGTNGPNGTIYAISAVPNGTIMIGGAFNSVGGLSRANVARLNADGTVDATFNPVIGPNDTVYAVLVQPDGRIVIGGAFTNVDNYLLNRLARFDADGRVDTTFEPGLGADDTIFNITLSPDAKLYIGGLFTSFNGTHRLGFARLLVNGQVDTGFLDTAYNQYAGLPKAYYNPDINPKNYVLTSVVQSDGEVLIGGRFDWVGGGRVAVDYFGQAAIQTNYYEGETRIRSSVRSRANFALLLNTPTTGPGNMGFLQDSYSVDENGVYSFIKLTRTNGTLCRMGANCFMPQRTSGVGVAQSGTDYSFWNVGPIYESTHDYGATTRRYSDGIWGTNNISYNVLGQLFGGVQADDVLVSLINNSVKQPDRNAPMRMDCPSQMDTVWLGGEDMAVSGALGKPAATFNIRDDDLKPGVINFASAEYFVNEGATNAIITLTRTDGSDGIVSVSYATTNQYLPPGTAKPGVDYTSKNGTLTFRDGQTTTNFTIRILDNSTVQPDRSINLRIANPSGGATLGQSNAVCWVIDDDFTAGHVNFTAATFATNKSAPAALINVMRAGGNSGTVSVRFSTTNTPTATSGVDYIGVTNTLTWNDKDTAVKTVSVPILSNGRVEPDKLVGLLLSNPSTNGLIGTVHPTATMQIINDNFYGKAQFVSQAYYVKENGGTATITVIRVNGSAETVAVNFEAVNGLNTISGADFVATNGTLVFGPGEVSKAFDVQIINNQVSDPPRFVTLNLSNPAPPGSLGSPSTAALWIVDDESYNEPAGSVDTAFDTSVGMDGDVYAVALQNDGNIVAAGDFSMVNHVARGRIARLNGLDATLDSSFLALGSGANAAIRALINQNDNGLVIGGVFTSFNGVVRNHIARLSYDGSIDSSFDPGSGTDNPVNTLAETFVNGSRKIVIGGSFTIANGIPRNAIARLNDDGSVDLGFNPGQGANGTVYAVAVYPTNTIQAGKTVIGGAFTSVNGVTLPYIARLNVDGSVDPTFNPGSGANGLVRAVAIQTDGRVLLGGDFSSVNGVAFNRFARLNVDGSLDSSFTPGVGANDSVQAIALQQDQRIVLAGEFTRCSGVTRNRLTRLLPDGTVDPAINFGLGANNFIDALAIQPDAKIVIGGGFTQVAGITRNRLARLYGGSITGSGQLTFTSAGYSVGETVTNAVITIRRTGGTAGTGPSGTEDVLVNFATSDGTAVAGVNYQSVDTAVSFPVGETFQTVLVPVLDDVQITPDLTVNLALSNPTPPAALGGQPIAVLTIVNRDSAVSFSSATYSRNENAIDGAATIHLIRSGSSEGYATVNFSTTTNGTALPMVNYIPVSTNVLFAPGDTDKSVKIPILYTAAAEGDTTVTMAMDTPINTVLLSPSEATLTIIDVDRAPGQVAFSAPGYIVGEGDGNAVITVVRTNGLAGVVTVAFATVPGTATPGLKYVSTNGILTFADRETSKSFAVKILDEGQVTGDQYLSIQLSNPTGGAAISGPASVPLVIADNDIGLSFSSPAYVVNETDSSVLVSVLRLNGSNGVTTVNYSTTNGTAYAGTNYVTTSGLLTFNSGETLKTLTIPILHDPRVTGNLAFSVYLANASSGAQLVPPNPTTVVIVDTDAGLSFTNSTFSVMENATNIVLTVLRSNANSGVVSVNYATSDDTALAGVDYVATSGLLTFTNGETARTITIPIIDNQLVQSDRTFAVNLFNPTAGAQLIPPSTAQVTIIDNDAGLRFSSPIYRVMKNGVSATIPVWRTGYTNSTVSVNYSTEDGTAKAGTNYFPASGTLVFTNGETSQSFTVGVIDDNIVAGDKTVLLKLANPLGNSSVVTPGAATLTIVDSNGSLIVPAGVAMTAESVSPANGVIDPGETVTMLFAFRDAGGLNATNMIATLLATNGVASPSGPQTYGSLIVGGSSVSRPFTFTANGTNGSQLFATFSLKDGTKDLGLALFTFSLGTTTTTFSNGAPITINDYAPATPYPAVINVNGMGGVVNKVTATLTNLTHSAPYDIDMLLVSPGGQRLLLMANCGGNNLAQNVTLNFDDAAAASLPQFGQIVSGIYKPTAYPPVVTFPTPAPPVPYASTLSTFANSNPNGPWSLYIIDDTQSDIGSIANGWKLSITTADPVPSASDMSVVMTATPEPVIVTSNLTYTLLITNYGPATATSVVVTNSLPAGAAFVSATPSVGSASTNAGLLVWSVGSLPINGKASLVLVIRPTAAGTIDSQATVSSGVADLNPGNNLAAVTSTVVASTADLALGVFDLPDPVLAGFQLTYTINVTNLGPATASSVRLTNQLPAGVVFVSASGPGTHGTNGNTVWFILGDVGAGAQMNATIVARATIPGTVTASASVTSLVTDPLKANNFAAVKTDVAPLHVGMTASGQTVTICWPDLAGAVLQSTPNLNPPVVWNTVATPPPSGGIRCITVGTTNGMQYYRLQPPSP